MSHKKNESLAQYFNASNAYLGKDESGTLFDCRDGREVKDGKYVDGGQAVDPAVLSAPIKELE